MRQAFTIYLDRHRTECDILIRELGKYTDAGVFDASFVLDASLTARFSRLLGRAESAVALLQSARPVVCHSAGAESGFMLRASARARVGRPMFAESGFVLAAEASALGERDRLLSDMDGVMLSDLDGMTLAELARISL